MKTTKELAREMGLLRRRSKAEGPAVKRSVGKNQPFQYLVVIDFESTCWKDQKFRTQEIIEFPAVLLNTTSGVCESEFHFYVQPSEDPSLSDFCKELTGITQAQVEDGIPLSLCMKKFRHWIEKLNREKNVLFNPVTDHPVKGTFLTWSDWDLSVCLQYECKRKQILKPGYLNSWVDIRATYRNFYGRKPNGLNGALQDLGIEFSGRQHSGVDDARNTARLAWRMIRDGCVLNVTKTIKGGDRSPGEGTPVRDCLQGGRTKTNTHLSSNGHKQPVADIPHLFKRPFSPVTPSGSYPADRSPLRKHSRVTQQSPRQQPVMNNLSANGSDMSENRPVCVSLSRSTLPLGRPSSVCSSRQASQGSCKPANSVPHQPHNSSSGGHKNTVPRQPHNSSSGGHTNTVPRQPHNSLSGGHTNTVPCQPHNSLSGERTNTVFRVPIKTVAGMPTSTIFRKPTSAVSSRPTGTVTSRPSNSGRAAVNSKACTTDSNNVYRGKTPSLTERSNTNSANLSKSTGKTLSLKFGVAVDKENVSPLAHLDKAMKETHHPAGGDSTASPMYRGTLSAPRPPIGMITPVPVRRVSSRQGSCASITPPLCLCGRRSRKRFVQSPGPNQGRCFYSCTSGRRPGTVNNSRKAGCQFFTWENVLMKGQTMFVPAANRNAMSTGLLRRQVTRVQPVRADLTRSCDVRERRTGSLGKATAHMR